MDNKPVDIGFIFLVFQCQVIERSSLKRDKEELSYKIGLSCLR
jgi:hypothetical protein